MQHNLALLDFFSGKDTIAANLATAPCCLSENYRGKEKLCITRGANMGAGFAEEGLKESNIDQLACVPSVTPLIRAWVQVPTYLCGRHVLHRCSAVPGATGRPLGVCVVFSLTGPVDNLPPVATDCDSAEVSTGLWIRSVDHWFITWHALEARWCISKKFAKESLKFIWDAGIQIQSRDAWLCNIPRRVICLQILLIYILTDIRTRPVVGVFGSVISSPSLGFICWPRKLSGNWRAEVFHGIFGPSLQRPLSLSH